LLMMELVLRMMKLKTLRLASVKFRKYGETENLVTVGILSITDETVGVDPDDEPELVVVASN